MSTSSPYIGRFAPSPTGPLHFGSLVAALASFLDAKAHRGQWLVRMEDLDPAREPEGAADDILTALEQLGLEWDGAVLYQSQRLEQYAHTLQLLEEKGLIYPCACSRAQIKEMGGIYDNRCRNGAKTHGPYAKRMKVTAQTIAFTDRVQGPQSQNLIQECGDFVLVRKDGLFAYQLAVVADDAFQGITDIVRGIDLLDSTARQIYMQEQLGFSRPQYAHIPVAVNELGQKLSKQHFAKALTLSRPQELLYAAMQFLGLTPEPDLLKGSVADTLQWGVEHWDIQKVPKLANIQLDKQFL
ncbi:MAG: tRNA glutamyl-Q(34) synthetase GluQRS [Pseudohongiellaceae bacterium]|nr:tRNA glutamyl-Q(34) synthetase GluQRS [Pseudohongiellaceae bacterium]